MQILDLRHLSSADLRPLLEQETRSWARLLEWDYRPSAEMILRYVDAKILPGYAAVDQGHVSGYAFFVYESSKGVIGDLYVGNGQAVPGGVAVEETLLKHVIETLQNSPGVHRIEAQLLAHPAGAVSQAFLREGFRRYPRLFMLLPLRGAAQAPGPVVPPAIHLRNWSEEDFQPAAGVITAAYRGHVDSEINDQYRTAAGAMRFLNNIVRFPGCGTFDAPSSFVALEHASRQLVGLILCSRVKDDVGHVTQVCVLPEARRRGIGEALMAATTANLQRRNFAALSLTVTEANTRAVELYKRLGFTIERVFDAFVWEG